MQVDWQQIDYKREKDEKKKKYYFYFRPDINTKTMRQTRGDMVTGWFEIEYEGSLQWFYFRGDGTMVASDWVHDEEDWYYMRSTGPMLKSNWKQGKDNEWYYLKSDGKMAKNEEIVVDGVTYIAEANGVCTEKGKSNAGGLSFSIVQNLIPISQAHRPGTKMTPTTLTIHSTANINSSAKNERDWLVNPSNTRSASWHLAVDEKEAVMAIPLNEVAWHAGPANSSSFSIEICESGNRTKTLENAIELTAYYLKQYGWNTSALRTHNDWTGKNCPRILIDSTQRKQTHETWEWFVEEVDKLL